MRGSIKAPRWNAGNFSEHSYTRPQSGRPKTDTGSPLNDSIRSILSLSIFIRKYVQIFLPQIGKCSIRCPAFVVMSTVWVSCAEAIKPEFTLLTLSLRLDAEVRLLRHASTLCDYVVRTDDSSPTSTTIRRPLQRRFVADFAAELRGLLRTSSTLRGYRYRPSCEAVSEAERNAGDLQEPSGGTFPRKRSGDPFGEPPVDRAKIPCFTGRCLAV